jgi:hypothetical protein
VERCKVGRCTDLFAWTTDCNLRKNINTVVPFTDFTILENGEEGSAESTKNATMGYQGPSRFCKTCGVLPWYIARSNPDGYAITLQCVDWTAGGTKTPPEIVTQKFDGIHWEESFAAFNDPFAKK